MRPKPSRHFISREKAIYYAEKLTQTHDINEARKLHHRIVEDECSDNVFIQNLMVQMYGQCGFLDDARNVFEGIAKPNRFSWNYILQVYANDGNVKETRSLFDRAKNRDDITWTALLTANARTGHLQEARFVFEMMPLGGIIAWTTMFVEHALHGYILEAVEIFGRMPHRDVVSWNAFVAAYAQNGHIREARCTFDRMPYWTLASWNSIITAHGIIGDVEGSREVFNAMPEQNTISWNAMISVYAQSTSSVSLEECKSIFDAIPRRNVITWTSLFRAYASYGQLDDAKRVFEAMPQHDAVSWSTLIQSQAQTGNVVEARKLFDAAPKKNLLGWNLIIGIYAACDDSKCALELFRQMDLEGLKPDIVTYSSMFRTRLPVAACNLLHECAIVDGFGKDRSVLTGLISTYGRSGYLTEALTIFNAMQERDLLAWTSIITGYASKGHGNEAFNMVRTMSSEGVQPDEVFFINILVGCSHGGLVYHGREFFMSMILDYGIKPLLDHFVAMVDLLGRVGKLMEAEDIMHCMPYQPDVVVCRSLLHSCILHGNKQGVQRLSRLLEAIDPAQSMPYLKLSHT